MRKITRLLVTIGFLIVSTPGANGHTSLSDSNPTDRQTIYSDIRVLSLDFTDKVTLLPNAIKVVNSNGQKIPTKEPKLETIGNISTINVGLDKKLQDGWYAVGWKVISADGHPRTGAFSFSVDTNSDGVTGKQIEYKLLEGISDPNKSLRLVIQALRTIGYLTMLTVTGLTVFMFIVLNKIQNPSKTSYLTKYISRISATGAVVTLLNWSIETKVLFDSYFAIQNLLILPTGISYGTRLIVYIIIYLISKTKGRNKITVNLYPPTTLLLLISYTFTGHTAVLTPRWLGGISLLIHLSTAAIWSGGIVGLFLSLRKWGQSKIDKGNESYQQQIEEMKSIISKFSILASTALALLALAASALAITTIGEPSKLISTNYGRALTLKIILVAILASIGWYNHYKLIPKMAIANSGMNFDYKPNTVFQNSDHNKLKITAENSEDLISKLYRLLKVELILILLVALITGLLTTHTAPRVENKFGNGLDKDASYWSFLLPGHIHTPGMDMSSYQKTKPNLTDRSTLKEGVETAKRVVGRGKIESNQVTLTLIGDDTSGKLEITLLNPFGEEVKLQALDVELSHSKTNVGPLQRKANYVNNRWEISANDLQIKGVWDITLKARIDNFSLIEGNLKVTISK